MKINIDLMFFLFYGSIFYVVSLALMFFVIRNILIKYFKVVYQVRCEICKEKGMLVEDEPELTTKGYGLTMENTDENKNVHSRHT